MSCQVIMIGGMPRSGTTLFSNYIQESLNIPVSPETHCFSSAPEKIKKVNIEALPKPVSDDALIGPIYKELEGRSFKDSLDLFDTVLRKVFQGKFSVVGEKTPRHIMSFDWIAQRRSLYKFVVMQRSCDEVCSSLKKVPWNDGNVLKNSFRWAKYYFEGLRLKKKYPDRVIIVDYGEFCRDPERILSRLEVEIGVAKTDQYVDGFKNYDETIEPWKKGSRSKPYAIKAKKNLTLFSTIYLKFLDTTFTRIAKFYVFLFV